MWCEWQGGEHFFPLPGPPCKYCRLPFVVKDILKMTGNSIVLFWNNNDPDMPRLGADDSDDNRSSYDYQTYDVSDFYIFDMIVASLPVNENAFDGDIGDANFFPNYDYAEPSMLLDVAEQYIMLPFLEETVKMSDINNA
ncbi:hypothetical protein CMV_013189 [Castanea mollissima]|uniref:Uncharacterized protein n=1 Tax=Castanea mollissima TaxID=60419 RepID=A0A8J4VM79_9ROSI|nr:hypothetical protein CMV_013189 [Castanea mollissima]